MAEKTQTFEEAYERLEEILDKMNAEKVSLDAALSLYEEADELIGACQKRLTEAEAKIEVLIKNREGNVLLAEENKPATEPFTSTSETTL